MIEAGTVLRIHYELSLAGGEIIESTFDDEPERVVYGRGDLPLYLERRIADMVPGEERELTVPAAAAAFGARDPGAVQRLDAALFDAAQLVPGSLVEFETPAGDWVRGRIEAVEGDSVTVDFNNPLIGREVGCRLRLVGIVPSEQHS